MQSNSTPADAVQDSFGGFWIRAGAAFIDGLLYLVLTSPVLVAVYGWDYFDTRVTGFIAGPTDFLIGWVLAPVATIVFWRRWQATPGKMVFSLRIADSRSGAKPSISQCIGRYFAYLVSSIPLGFGFIWVTFDKRKQGWHDKLARTIVIRSTHHGFKSGQ